MFLGESKTPEGTRLYAIGDVHGCDTLLAEMHGRIAADLIDRPIGDYRIIHIGDYTDRGPDSAGVLTRLAAMSLSDPNVICLRGNHDQMLLDFLTDPERAGTMFLANGGDATLASYGVAAGAMRYHLSGPGALARQLAGRIPAAQRAFLDGLGLSVRFGDYFFCHAGIMPGVPLDQQDPDDLIWIRGAFLTDTRDHGVVVIHGHTPRRPLEVKPNRINLDTGAVYGGPLTCVVLEGTGHRFLSVGSV